MIENRLEVAEINGPNDSNEDKKESPKSNYGDTESMDNFFAGEGKKSGEAYENEKAENWPLQITPVDPTAVVNNISKFKPGECPEFLP